jgi:hypothetical protein
MMVVLTMTMMNVTTTRDDDDCDATATAANDTAPNDQTRPTIATTSTPAEERCHCYHAVAGA